MTKPAAALSVGSLSLMAPTTPGLHIVLWPKTWSPWGSPYPMRSAPFQKGAAASPGPRAPAGPRSRAEAAAAAAQPPAIPVAEQGGCRWRG